MSNKLTSTPHSNLSPTVYTRGNQPLSDETDIHIRLDAIEDRLDLVETKVERRVHTHQHAWFVVLIRNLDGERLASRVLTTLLVILCVLLVLRSLTTNQQGNPATTPAVEQKLVEV